MTFTKADLIDQVHSSNLKLTKAHIREAAETIFSIIKSILESSKLVHGP
jgi:nucleoid DNA-binding protein